jgi:hypothetical protein
MNCATGSPWSAKDIREVAGQFDAQNRRTMISAAGMKRRYALNIEGDASPSR